MGTIQNTLNSAMSGTAFLLNQSGALDNVKTMTQLKRNVKLHNAYIEGLGDQATKEEQDEFVANQLEVARSSNSLKMQHAVGSTEATLRRNKAADAEAARKSRYEATEEYQRDMYNSLMESVKARVNAETVKERLKGKPKGFYTNESIAEMELEDEANGK